MFTIFWTSIIPGLCHVILIPLLQDPNINNINQDKMLVQSRACCTRPPVTLSGGYDYEVKGSYVLYDGLKTCKIHPAATTCLPSRSLHGHVEVHSSLYNQHCYSSPH